MGDVLRFPIERVPYSATRLERERPADVIVLPMIRYGWDLDSRLLEQLADKLGAVEMPSDCAP